MVIQIPCEYRIRRSNCRARFTIWGPSYLYRNDKEGPEPRDDSRPSNEPTDVTQGSKMNRTRNLYAQNSTHRYNNRLQVHDVCYVYKMNEQQERKNNIQQ